MKMFELTTSTKGILLIIAGIIILFNSLGFVTELLHSIVLFGSIAMIILGILMSNVHRWLFSLISGEKKENKDINQTPPS